ncbi:MAG: hypothetical protein R8K20_10085 [Gallionellaceae bacterium]
MFKRLRAKIQRLYILLIAPPKHWTLPKNCEILIYDAMNSKYFAPYLSNRSVGILPVRGESVNIPCLLYSMLKINFWTGKPLRAYVHAYIQITSPKLLITFIDNDINFYEISHCFSRLKTMFIQNGSRSEVGDVFDSLVPSDNYHVDYMLVHGAAIGNHYKKYISGSMVEIGSLKNNEVRKESDTDDKTILFVSQYSERTKHDNEFIKAADGASYSWDQFYSAEIQVIKFLNNWCLRNNRILLICGRGFNDECDEKHFYAEYLTDCEWRYVPRNNFYSSYKLVDSAEVVVFIDSTLGYESIGRGNKTASFSCRGSSLANNKGTKFGWPLELPDNGPFWTNLVSESEFCRVMDYLITVSAHDWEETRQHYAKELMSYDFDNTRFIKLLSEIVDSPQNSI